LTLIAIDLIQADDNKSWAIFISNPKWDSWIPKKTQHFLWIVAINPNKVWRTNWTASENGKEIFMSARAEFINSLADAKAVTIYDETRRSLIALPLNMKDSEDAIRAVVNCVRDHPLTSPPEARNRSKSSTASSSGTGFFVAPNLLVTNNHVIKECGAIEVRYPDHRWYTATIEGQDNTNDLALLHTDLENLSVASFRLQSRVGEPVAAYGFPYAGLLSSGGNFTMGNVAALAGMDDDSRFIQISAQVQPGNSGGPLLDLSGSVIGVISSRLNAIKMMREGG
jgi:S1-C subfamily serine protease